MPAFGAEVDRRLRRNTMRVKSLMSRTRNRTSGIRRTCKTSPAGPGEFRPTRIRGQPRSIEQGPVSTGMSPTAGNRLVDFALLD